MISPSNNAAQNTPLLTPGGQGNQFFTDQLGINPWMGSPESGHPNIDPTLTGAVTDALIDRGAGPVIPDTPNFDSPSQGSVAASDLAGQGADMVLPWISELQGSGIFKPAASIGPGSGLQGEYDLIGAMLGRGGQGEGGGWDVNPQETEIHPAVESMFQENPELREFYENAPRTQPHHVSPNVGLEDLNTFRESGWYDNPPEAEINPDVEAMFQENPEWGEFYENARGGQGGGGGGGNTFAVDPYMEHSFWGTPTNNLSGAFGQRIETPTEISDLLPEGMRSGGSFEEQLQDVQTIFDAAGHEEMPDWAQPGAWDPYTPLGELEDDALGGYGATIREGRPPPPPGGPQGDPMENIFSSGDFLGTSMDTLQQFMPGTYPTPENT